MLDAKINRIQTVLQQLRGGLQATVLDLPGEPVRTVTPSHIQELRAELLLLEGYRSNRGARGLA
jgi:hypothetical protein